VMACRPGCGACCIAPSITSPMPGMPQGKPAGIRCQHLTPDNRCRIHGRPERPAFCAGFSATPEHCGADREEALLRLGELERLTVHVRRRDDRS
jgi:Fe-S-cluster containining protein